MEKDLEASSPLDTGPNPQFDDEDQSSTLPPSAAPSSPPAHTTQPRGKTNAVNRIRSSKSSSKKDTGTRTRENLSDETGDDSDGIEDDEVLKKPHPTRQKRRRAPKSGQEELRTMEEPDEEKDETEVHLFGPEAEHDDRQPLTFDPEMPQSSNIRRRILSIPGISSALTVLTSSYLNFAGVTLPFPFIFYLAGWNRGALLILSLLPMFAASSLVKTAQTGLLKRSPSWAGTIISVLLTNAIPLIAGSFAVHGGLTRMVQGILVGSILHRLLLTLGLALAVNARNKSSKVEDRNARVAASMLNMTLVIFVLPSLLIFASPLTGLQSAVKLSRWCAIFLLVLLGLSFVFTLKTHDKFWDKQALTMSRINIGYVSAVVTLLIGLGYAIYSSWLVVYAAPWVAENWGLSHTFMGGILLPLAFNAAELVEAIKLAFIGNLKSPTLEAIRGSLEVCLLTAPLLVLGGWMSAQSIGLGFSSLVALTLVLAAANLAFMLHSLKLTWFQGATMCITYLLIALGYFFSVD